MSRRPEPYPGVHRIPAILLAVPIIWGREFLGQNPFGTENSFLALWWGGVCGGSVRPPPQGPPVQPCLPLFSLTAVPMPRRAGEVFCGTPKPLQLCQGCPGHRRPSDHHLRRVQLPLRLCRPAVCVPVAGAEDGSRHRRRRVLHCPGPRRPRRQQQRQGQGRMSAGTPLGRRRSSPRVRYEESVQGSGGVSSPPPSKTRGSDPPYLTL